MANEARQERKRNAVIVAATVEVLCPYCSESQPNPDNGAFPWTPDEVKAQQGEKVCTSCEKPFRLFAQSRALVEATGAGRSPAL